MSFTKRPWYVSVCAFVLLAPVGASYVSEIRNEPPSRASNAWTWLVMPVGTFHVATARASRSARYTLARGALMRRLMRVELTPELQYMQRDERHAGRPPRPLPPSC
jgi:hypothetical protein